MKKYFRYLFLGVLFVNSLILTSCQTKATHTDITTNTSTIEQIIEEETTTKLEVVFDYYIVSSNQAKLYTSPNLDSEPIKELYKNSLIQIEVSENDLWKVVKIDEETSAYISSNDIQLVGKEFSKYTDYQIADDNEKYALVTVDIGNIRMLPDMNGEIVGKYKHGETVQVLGVTKNNWNMIKYNDSICYVSSEILTYISEEEYELYNLKITKSTFDESKSTLIGTYTTNFATSNNNRKYNIELGSSIINEFVIPSGALFDWCRDMGKCSKEKGFKESNEIVNGEYVKGYGGGVCQISSTLCAAILTSNSNFEFFERHKHSKAQKYIPREYDATVSYPNVNFVIKNCNEYPVMIKAYCNNGNLTVEIYAING